MGKIQNIHLKQLHGRLGEVVYQLTRVQFSQSSIAAWQPSVNAYRCPDCIVVCVDLAGVDRERLGLQVEPRRVLVSGHREPPEPERADHKPVQVLLMEIDYGRFQREVLLPCDVAPERVTAEQRNGLLWVYLPLRCQA
jgi:HSP20 family protein